MQVTLSQPNENVHSIQYPLPPIEYHINREGKKMIAHTTIRRSNDTDKVKLPAFLYHKVHTNQPLKISFGHRSVFTHACKSEHGFEMSEPLASQLLFPLDETTVSCQFIDASNELKIGPLIALLTSNDKPFGTMASFIEEMARYCIKNHAIFFVIPLPIQTDEQTDTLHGYLFSKNRWIKKTMPYPDVVYNRIASRNQEKSERAANVFARLKKQSIPIFNERFLNKWEVYNAFMREPVLRPHLPDTKLYRKASDLDTMLQQHPIVFAKPIHGSLGQKILKITQRDGKYRLQFSNAVNLQTKEYTLLALLRTAIPIIKSEPYILQQGIPALTYHGRCTDFRALCNKDKTGKWKVTSLVARCSPFGQIVSNLAMGGTLHHPEQILASRFSEREIKTNLKFCQELALHCAFTIEQHFHGLFGELGIDLVIDEDGKMWIIEVNTKPSKMNIGNDSTTIRPSTKALVQYAKFLAKRLEEYT